MYYSAIQPLKTASVINKVSYQLVAVIIIKIQNNVNVAIIAHHHAWNNTRCSVPPSAATTLIIHHPPLFHSRLKPSFSANLSHRSLTFLLQD